MLHKWESDNSRASELQLTVWPHWGVTWRGRWPDSQQPMDTELMSPTGSTGINAAKVFGLRLTVVPVLCGLVSAKKQNTCIVLPHNKGGCTGKAGWIHCEGILQQREQVHRCFKCRRFSLLASPPPLNTPDSREWELPWIWSTGPGYCWQES